MTRVCRYGERGSRVSEPLPVGRAVAGWLAMCALVAASPAWAQVASVSHEVVQALPSANDPGKVLNAALMQLARNPRDPEALLSAGESAVAMGDVQAGIGFLTRAEKLAPNDPRVLTALGSARLRSQDPVAALGLYDAAARAGPLHADQLADQGLSHDLVGDNIVAQRLYREALAKGAGDEAARRLALSLAIVGDRRGVDMVLAPMLQKQDRSAWRIRAFAFAIMGHEEEAVAIANTTMPADLASGMAPYLRYMRRLTPAQQAAAANLGFFPQASQIGQEDPAIAAFALSHNIHHVDVSQTELASADARTRTTPAKGDARKGRRGRSGDNTRMADAVGRSGGEGQGELAPPVPSPSRQAEPAVPVELAAAEPVARSRGASRVAPRSVPVALPVSQPAVPVRVVTPAAPAAATRVAEATPPATTAPGFGSRSTASGFDLARMTPAAASHAGPVPTPAAPPAAVAVSNVASSPPASVPVPSAMPTPPRPVFEQVAPASTPAPALTPALAPAPRPIVAVAAVSPAPAAPRTATAARPSRSGSALRPSFSDAFSGMAPTPATARPESGAVDIRKIAAPRPAPKAPPPPAHPSRIWVQVGVGRDSDRIAFDWRRMQREEPELFKAHKASVADWGRTNRVLTGPFDTEAAAKAFNDKLHKAGHDGTFVWVSPAGQVVDPLDAR